ncbi:hypothetical protein HZ996_06075 [Cryomorphaceae bacterium]|nr:hypothetical protein HZ996_06075 [Cryomorphaceae bacterium]
MDSVHAQTTTFNYGGYVKMDVLQTTYNNGTLSGTSPLRDFVLPGQIPVGNGTSSSTLDAHVKESRFNFDVTTEINEFEIHGFLELDFMLSSTGDEKVSNSFNPRIRHFYFEWDRMLIGQTWSTFMVVVVPDDLDFVGALEGLVANRQPQLRYKAGTWQFALENPESIVYSQRAPEQLISDQEYLPDVVVRKNFSGSWGTWSVAGMYRFLSISDSSGTHRTPGFGITTGGKIPVGKNGDDFRMVVCAGSGVGRYQAGAFVSDAAYVDFQSIRSLPTLNGYIAYNHYWIPNILSSSGNVGYFELLEPDFSISQEANQKAMSASINLKYDPVPQLRLGLEYAWASRELFDGTSGSLNRFQFSARYRFGFTTENAIEK